MQWASKLFGMGLLDPELEKRLSEAQRQQMGRASLMDAGIAMLANSGYSRMPTSTGQALAAGLGAGRASFAGQAQGLQEQMQRQQQAQAEEQQRQSILAGLDPEIQRFAAGLSLPQLMDVAKQSAGEKAKAMNRAPQTSTLQREAAQLFPGDTAQQNAWIQKQREKSSAPVVNVNMPGQKDVNWGEPPKDMVWARDESGNVVTEFDPQTGARRPVALPIKGSKDDAEVARGREQAASKALMSYNTIDQMLKHPGLDTAVGLSAQLDPRNYMYGSQAKGAQAFIEQAQGQAFLQAFESLKGGGQITQIEGEKATAAIARLQRSQSDEDFRAAAEELKQIAAKAYERATGRRIDESHSPQVIQPQQGGAVQPRILRRVR